MTSVVDERLKLFSNELTNLFHKYGFGLTVEKEDICVFLLTEDEYRHSWIVNEKDQLILT